MAEPQKVTVRKAREEDYEAVVGITKEFNLGADYLYYQYSELINDPDSSYYVCEVDGEVAAFEGVSLLDDNNTLMARSARVKDKFRGQGLLNQIRKKIYEDYKDVPGQKRIRTCCTNIVRLVDSATFRSQNRFLGTRALAIYENLDAVQLSAERFNKDISGIRTVDTEVFRILFQNTELTRYLFPTGFLAAISWFFDPLVSNIKHIQKQRPRISISAALDACIKKLNSCSSPEMSNLNSREQTSDDHPCGLLVVCVHYKTPDMIYFKIEIYGEPRQGQQDSELRAAIFDSLKYAISIIEEDGSKVPLAVGLGAKDAAILQECKDIVTPLGFKQGKMGAFECHNFFEQDFEQLLK
ncbi:hypothetical protein BsWGS_12820 [Bradybaena similaris]